jgi:hypothetical protein
MPRFLPGACAKAHHDPRYGKGWRASLLDPRETGVYSLATIDIYLAALRQDDNALAERKMESFGVE